VFSRSGTLNQGDAHWREILLSAGVRFAEQMPFYLPKPSTKRLCGAEIVVCEGDSPTSSDRSHTS